MFNPFTRYEQKYLQGFKQKGVKAFVLQTYERGRNLLQDEPFPSYLLTHYEQPEMAENHMDAIAHDPARRLLLVDHAEDYNYLLKLGEKNAPYLVYLRFKIADAELKAKKILDKKLHAYIDHKLQWKVSGKDTVRFGLDVIFGEIYVVLQYGGRYDKVLLSEIENMKAYVL